MSNFVDFSRFHIEYSKKFMKKVINADSSKTWRDKEKLNPYLELTRQG